MNNTKKNAIEFLIVFMAVFFGAVAENYREQYKERQQGREYISRFYQDLYSDLAKIDQTIREGEYKQKRLLAIDSLKYSPPTTEKEFIEIVGMIRDANVWSIPIHRPNTITLDQIKSTGAWDFIAEEQSEMVTGYQISVQRILALNLNIMRDIRETFDLIKKLPNDLSRYDAEDFDNRELQDVLNYIHELYWAHFGYNIILNQHKLFVSEILQKLAQDPEIIKNDKVYDLTANTISLVNIGPNRTFGNDDQFLTQNTNANNVWSALLELDSGRYLFRKGVSFETVWGISMDGFNNVGSGKALSENGYLIHLPSGRYNVALDLNDTTYTIESIK